MGGSIKVVHILDGKITPQIWWTNVLPEYVKNYNFIEGNRNYINSVLAEEEANKFEDRTDYDKLAPVDYGIDVFDFDKKEIYTIQGYTSYGRIDYVSIHLWIMGSEGSRNPKEKYFPSIVEMMWDKKMLQIKEFGGEMKTVDDYDYKTAFGIIKERYELWGKKGKNWDAASDEDKFPFQNAFFEINWNMFGWKYTKLEESVKGYKELMEIIKSQYHLEAKDYDLWDDYLKEEEEK